MYRPDTSEEVQRVYDEKVLSLTEEERFLRGLSLTHFCREVCFSSLKTRNPELSPGELKAKFFEDVYGQAFAADERGKIINHLKKT